MKKILLLPMVAALSMFSACNKQQSDAERQAEIDRQVQQKLDAEHQAQEREELARREGELNAREQSLADKKNARPQDRHVQDRQLPAEGRGDYGLFYSKLEPHGDWLETSDYGYVFHPREAQSSSWRPYTNGHWVYTDAGWTWISEESFGWATYHYGRWVRLRNIGWVWIPGDEWAPAWVSWRKNDNYVGWAPLPPEARFDRRSGIHNWADNYYDIGPENYCFIETRQFGSARVERAIVPSQQNVTIVNQTTNVTNITYNNTTIVNQGPSYDEIRTRSAEPVQRLKLERDVNVNINIGEPRPVVRADAVVVPAPVIAPARVVERPKIVKKTVTNIVVERGWDGLQDRQAAEQARAKIRSEATPPPNAPPKTFVRATETRAETTATPVSSATIAPSRAEASATATPNEPAASASPSVSVPPGLRQRPQVIPRGGSRSTSSMGGASASPGASAASTPINMRGPNGKLRSARKMIEANQSPTPADAVPAAPSASPESTATAPSGKMESQAQRMEPRRTIPLESPSASPSASVRSTSTPAAAASPSASEAARETKKERKRERREARAGLTSPSVSPTATP
jgi:hypothetical protein